MRDMAERCRPRVDISSQSEAYSRLSSRARRIARSPCWFIRRSKSARFTKLTVVRSRVSAEVSCGRSRKTELKLTNVARSSLEELRLDYEDFLRQRRLGQWAREDARRAINQWVSQATQGKIEELIHELKTDYTVLIVTHNMQQAARCSDFTAYMYLGDLVEFGPTADVFMKPAKKDTEDYITGRFG